MRGRLLVLCGMGALVAVGLFHIREMAYVRFPLFERGTLTLMTRPVGALPPHVHETTDMNVDSILNPGHGILTESDYFIVPEDLWIVGNEVLSENAPISVLHHLILAKEGGPNSECPERDEELYTIGADSTLANAFPEPFGIFLQKGERIYLSGMVHNPAPPKGEGGTYENVAIGFRFTTERPSKNRTRAVEFHRIALQDAPYCESLYLDEVVDVFSVPPNSPAFVKTSDVAEGVNPTRHVFSEPGLLIGFGAHMHPDSGGKNISMFLNGSTIGTVTPKEIIDEPWTWRTSYTGVGSILVKPGDVFTLSATYENPHRVPIEDAMGQAVFFFDPELR